MNIILVLPVIIAVIFIVMGTFVFMKYIDFTSVKNKYTEPKKLDSAALQKVKDAAKKAPEAHNENAEGGGPEKPEFKAAAGKILTAAIVSALAVFWVFLAFIILPGHSERHKIYLLASGLLFVSYLMPKVIPAVTGGAIQYGSGKNNPEWFPDLHIYKAALWLMVIGFFIPD